MKFRTAVSVLLAAVFLTGTLTACRAVEQEPPQETAAQVSLTSFTGRNGWKTRFNATLFEVWEKENSVRFVYSGEGEGSDELGIVFYPGRFPEDVLYEVTSDIDQGIPERYEGFFNADQGDWCFGRYISADKDTNGAERAYTAVEHNGGTLLIVRKSTQMDTDALQQEVDEGILQIREYFEWTDHQPQEEFAYVAGTYVCAYTEETEGREQQFTDTIVLNADHSGTLSFQDETVIYWTSFEIVDPSGNRAEFTVEGDSLYYDVTGDCREFTRKP